MVEEKRAGGMELVRWPWWKETGPELVPRWKARREEEGRHWTGGLGGACGKTHSGGSGSGPSLRRRTHRDTA